MAITDFDPTLFDKSSELNTYTVGDMSNDMMKGKSLPVGTRKKWGGVEYEKTAQGWQPVKSNKQSKQEDEKVKKPKQEDQPEQKELSDEELNKFAKETSDEDLKRHAGGKDERLRVAAKKELERRKGEGQDENMQGSKDIQDDGEKGKEKSEGVGNSISVTSERYRSAAEEMLSTALSGDVSETAIIKQNENQEIQNESGRYIASSLAISSADGEEEKSKEKDAIVSSAVLEFFETRSIEDISNLFNAGELVSVRKRGNTVTFTTDQMFATRTFMKKAKTIQMCEMVMSADQGGQGKGTTIFASQVKGYSKLGYETLNTVAARSGTLFNGYYTWAVLGYELGDGDARYKFEVMKNKSDNPRIRKCETLNELMSFDEGKAFWKENGFTFNGVFDMRKGSPNVQHLNRYLESKGKIDLLIKAMLAGAIDKEWKQHQMSDEESKYWNDVMAQNEKLPYMYWKIENIPLKEVL